MEAEGVGRAASGSATADEANARLGSLEEALRAADAACSQAVRATLPFTISPNSALQLHDVVLSLGSPLAVSVASITVIVMPRLVFRQVSARLKLAAQQAKQHSDSAAALRRRQEELEQKSAQVASHMVQVSNLSCLLIPL